MIRALLDGTKTQTRRVVKFPKDVTPQNATALTYDERIAGLRTSFPNGPESALPLIAGPRYEGQRLLCNLINDVGLAHLVCPHGEPGDRLWVRETWGQIEWTTIIGRPGRRTETVYRADGDKPHGWHERNVWKPSIHMPRRLSRLTLEITDVRVERVQEISYESMKGEGALPCHIRGGERAVLQREYFAPLWDSLSAKRGYGWDVNPWVWVLTFRRVDA